MKDKKITFGLSIAGIVLTILILIFLFASFGSLISYINSQNNSEYWSDPISSQYYEKKFTSTIYGLLFFATTMLIILIIINIISIVYVSLIYKKDKSQKTFLKIITLLVFASIALFIYFIFSLIAYSLLIKVRFKVKNEEFDYYFKDNQTYIKNKQKDDFFTTRWI